MKNLHNRLAFYASKTLENHMLQGRLKYMNKIPFI